MAERDMIADSKAVKILAWLESDEGKRELQKQVTRDSESAKKINKAADVSISALMRAFTA